MNSIILPPNLEDLVVERFDQLLLNGELFYQSSEAEYVTHKDFKFEFHITGALKKKPIMVANDPGRKKAIGPFEDPDPKFAITTVGSLHALELNMYCVHRPSLILHTNTDRSQTEVLDEGDIAASFAMLRAIKSPFLLFYNCGVEASSSQGHKHLQLIPKPDAEFQMFLDMNIHSSSTRILTKEQLEAIDNTTARPCSLEKVTNKHWALAISDNSTSVAIYNEYLRLLVKTTEALKAESAIIVYIVIATTKWVCLIPEHIKLSQMVLLQPMDQVCLAWSGLPIKLKGMNGRNSACLIIWHILEFQRRKMIVNEFVKMRALLCIINVVKR